MPHRPTPWGRRARRALAVALAVVSGAVLPTAAASADPAASAMRPAPGIQLAPDAQAAPRIVGGTVLTSNASAPYTVAIQTQFGDVAFGGCSGTVLDPLHVLTAAHCFVRDGVVAPAANIRVGAGYHEIVSETGRASVTVVDVATVRVHPRYVSSAFTDDVAVLTLAEPLDFSTGEMRLSVCNTDSVGEQLQRAFPDARVVKSINTVNGSVMVEPGDVPRRPTRPIVQRAAAITRLAP